MIEITAYLHFKGNAREAMTFYQECLGGDLFIQTVAETPVIDCRSAKLNNQVMHASLTLNNVTIFGTDMEIQGTSVIGNAIVLCINCSSPEEIRRFYKNLARGGEPGRPLTESFWGSTFGDLKDKFGFHWMLNYDEDVFEL